MQSLQNKLKPKNFIKATNESNKNVNKKRRKCITKIKIGAQTEASRWGSQRNQLRVEDIRTPQPTITSESVSLSRQNDSMLMLKKPLDTTNSNSDMFYDLRVFLKTLFNLSFDPMSDAYIDVNNLRIAATIINKKFAQEFELCSLYTMDLFQALVTTKPIKRPEESYKFIFKHTFKSLKAAYRADCAELSNLSFEAFNIRFYSYYFAETAARLNIGLYHFFLPLTPDSYCNKKQRIVAQTINASYITLVCQSQKFMRDFLTYVNNRMLADYAKLILAKVDNMCDKWEQLFLSTHSPDKIIDFICEYVDTNKKCKLPWTVNEVEHAIKVVNRLVHKCSLKSLAKSKDFINMDLSAK